MTPSKNFPADSIKDEMVQYSKKIQNECIAGFEAFEPSHRFERKKWNYHKGKGGGEIAVLRGKVFEKAAVNWSGVSGDKFPTSEMKGPFFATGVSLITHMANPKAPTVHFNIRYIETKHKSWFGGGYDLTPMGFPFEEDTQHFHGIAKKSLEPFGKDLYEKFSAEAKSYFTIPHYNRERGVGGVFFDNFNSGSLKKDFDMVQSIADHFLEAILPIYEKRIHEPFTEADRQVQLKKRGHYVEFNLIYDRGTKFGFRSGGNPEAILCSMPPLAAW